MARMGNTARKGEMAGWKDGGWEAGREARRAWGTWQEQGTWQNGDGNKTESFSRPTAGVSLLVGVFNCLNETVYAVKEGLPTVFKKKVDLATGLETV